jgi:hypothetical protein
LECVRITPKKSIFGVGLENILERVLQTNKCKLKEERTSVIFLLPIFESVLVDF